MSSSLFVSPDSDKISPDIPCPFVYDDSKPRAYVTYNWREAFERDGDHPLVAMLKESGFEVYPWWDVRHGTATKPAQCKWITEFIGHPNTSLFLWDLSTRGNSESLDGSSKVIWHMCMGLGLRCILYDSALAGGSGDFERPVAADTGFRKHPILNYLPGTVIGKRLPNDSVTVMVDTPDRLKEAVDWAASSGDLPEHIALPSDGLHMWYPTEGKPAVYLTCDWKSAPKALREHLETAGYETYPWWNANFHRGAPHPIQTARIIRFMMRPEFRAFVADVSNYVDREGNVRFDGSGKFLWQFLVGRCLWLIHRENPRRAAAGLAPLPLPTLVYMDSLKKTRVPVPGTDVCMHPSMAFMCAHTVNRPVGGVVTHYVETAEEAVELLAS